MDVRERFMEVLCEQVATPTLGDAREVLRRMHDAGLVVVSREDVEAAVGIIEGEFTDRNPEMRVAERLRAALTDGDDAAERSGE